MAKLTYAFALDMRRRPAFQSFELVSGDTGVVFEITLLDNGFALHTEMGCAIKVVAAFRRPDGKTVIQDSASGVSVSNNVVTVDVAQNAIGIGNHACELQVYTGTDDGDLLTSMPFLFHARAPINGEEAIKGSAEYPPLVEAIREATEATEAANAAAGQVATSAAAAQQAAADAAQAVEDAQAAVAAAVAATVEVGTVTTGEPGTEASVTNSGTENAAVLDFTIPRGDPAGPHAAQHAAGGSDPITPAAIGAIPSVQKGTASGVATLDANSKVAATQASSRIIDVSANITLAAQHAGCLICAIQSNNTITIPSDADNAIFSIGTEIEVLRYWSQTVTITAASDVYLYGGGSGSLGRSITIGNQHGMIALKKIRANEWLAVGDIG